MPKDNNKTKKEKKHFFKDLRAELKKVIWPTPKQLANNTVAVITIVLITAVLVFALDFAFRAVNTYVVDGIKSAVQTNSTNDETTNTTDENNTNEVNTNTTNTVYTENNQEQNTQTQNVETGTAVNEQATGSEQENVVE